MAASSQPLVTQTALKILEKGGSAVDAAIAANLIQGLVEPMNCGIGGDLMAIIYNPTDKKLYGYNGSGRSSSNFSYDDMLNFTISEFNSTFIPSLGPYSITVPGALQGMCDIHKKFGKLEWSELFEDAIYYSINGFAITQIISKYWEDDYEEFEFDNDAIREMTTNNQYPNATFGFFDIYSSNSDSGESVNIDMKKTGRRRKTKGINRSNIKNKYSYTSKNNKTGSPSFGELFKNPKLGAVYSMIANASSTTCGDIFYRGELTSKLVEYLNSVGSHLTINDFNNHFGEWIDPVNTTYRDEYLISELPPNPQGIAALQMLNMMELYPLNEWNLHSSNYLHVNIEIKKLVFADRAQYYADMSYKNVCVPVDTLISKSYAKERVELINMTHAADYCTYGIINCTLSKEIEKEIDRLYKSDTVYLTTADSDGMMVSWIQSNYNGFGSGIVTPEYGFAFQNRGSLFSLIKGSNNQYESNKRPFHTIMPGFMHKRVKTQKTAKTETIDENGEKILKDEYSWEPYISFGVMGGDIQPQGQVQIVSNIVDFGLNVQEAGDAARWSHSGSQEPTGSTMDSNGGTVTLESGICESIANNLTARGHDVGYSPNTGGYQAIMRDIDTGVYFGATEMRKDGVALGY